MHLSSLVSRGFYRALLGSCSLALLVGVIAPAAHGQRVIRPVRVAGVPAGLPGPYAPGAPCPTPGGATLGVYYQPGARVLYWAAARQDYRFDLPAPIQSWTWSCAGAFIFGANLAWDELVIYDQSGDLIAINPALFGARFRGTRHALGGIGPAQLNGGRCGPGKTAIVPTRGGRRGVSGGRVRAYVGPPGVPFAPPNGPPNLTFNGSGSSAGSATAAAAENVGLRFVESSGLANEFGVSSGQFNATSRSGIAGASHGDILAKFQGDLAGNVGRDFAAIGQGESHAGELNGFRCIIQDQNATTQEQYQFVVVDDDPQSPGQPDPSLDGFALRTASLTSPSGSGTAAWRVTVTFSVPQFVLPNTETIYAGLTVAPNAAWVSDGLSVHMGAYGAGGENPAPGAPTRTASVVRPGFGQAGTVAATVSPRCHAIWLLTRSDILQVGADVPVARRHSPASLNPDFGTAGAYPFLRMGDGLAWRHRGAAGTVVLLLSANRSSAPIEFDFLTGKLMLDPATMTTIGSGIQTATRDLAFAPSFTAAGAITGLAGSGWIQWQSVRVGAGLFASNGVASKL